MIKEGGTTSEVAAGSRGALFIGHLSTVVRLGGKSMQRFAIAFAAILCLALATPVYADEPIVIKFSHVVSPDAPKGKAALAVQGAGREIHQRQSEGRSLSELFALQGQGGAGGVAARLGAAAGAVDLQIRPARRQGIRHFRSAVPDERRCACAPDDGEPDDGRAQQEARGQGRVTARLLGQRRPRLYREQAAASCRTISAA